MIQRALTVVAIAFTLLVGLASVAQSGSLRSHTHGDRSGASYGIYHKHYGSCGSAYAARYRHKRPHYYSVAVKPGRYSWRKRRIRVGTIRRHGRVVPRYRWVRQRVLVRPVRYRVRKRHAHGRWVSNPVVVKGSTRWRRRSAC